MASSPYFDLNNVVFNVRNDGETRTAEIAADEPFSYVLEEFNMLSGESNEYPFEESGSYTLPTTTENAIYSYRLGVYFNGKRIGYAHERREPDFSFYNSQFRYHQARRR